ncbi:MAG: HNH endonuclease [Actinobacteria bacterium]|nr:HNH endonuclease [Actinomycetota bacterium]
MPLFVISHHIRNASQRQVHLGWVEGWDDNSEMFLITFTEAAPAELLDADHSDEHEFRLTGNRSRRAPRNVRVRPGQSRFKFRVFQRYGTRCPLSGVTVPEMLDAAHLVPDAQDGTDDPRNGLPLNAALHRAFDADLFTINPDTLKVITKPNGPTLGDLGIITPNLEHLPHKPHREALQWRYQAWSERQEPR